MGTISKNFSFAEFERSDTADRYGVANAVTRASVRDAMVKLVREVLQPLRDKVGVPIHINSGYRSARVNDLVGGVSTSQHCKGEAADIVVEGMTPYMTAKTIVTMGLPYDQLILYPDFVHVSHKLEGEDRGQLLYNKTYRGRRL